MSQKKNGSAGRVFAHIGALILSIFVGYQTAFLAFCYCAGFIVETFNLQSFGGIISLPFGLFGAILWCLAVGLVPQVLLGIMWALTGKKK